MRVLFWFLFGFPFGFHVGLICVLFGFSVGFIWILCACSFVFYVGPIWVQFGFYLCLISASMWVLFGFYVGCYVGFIFGVLSWFYRGFAFVFIWLLFLELDSGSFFSFGMIWVRFLGSIWGCVCARFGFYVGIYVEYFGLYLPFMMGSSLGSIWVFLCFMWLR